MKLITLSSPIAVRVHDRVRMITVMEATEKAGLNGGTESRLTIWAVMIDGIMGPKLGRTAYDPRLPIVVVKASSIRSRQEVTP